MLILSNRKGFLGNDLLTHPVTRKVPSALEGLTAGFGMGPGIPPPLKSPRNPILHVNGTCFACAQTYVPIRLNALLSASCTLKTEQGFLPKLTYKTSIISTAQLKTLQPVHLPPIYLVVFQGSYWLIAMGDLILRRASHLDAFSGYPCQTWLPSDAPGGTTGSPVVCSLRSSRTRSNSSQITCAHSG